MAAFLRGASGTARKARWKIRKNRGYLTIMLFKEAGKVRRFTISSRLVVCASLFFLFYVVATTYFTNRYLDIRRVNKIQAGKIVKLSRELARKARSLERSKQHIALLDEYLRETEWHGQEPGSKGNRNETPLPEVVGIEDLKVKRAGSTVNAYFRIVNRRPDGEPVEGYVFVIASEKDSDPSEAWVYPGSPLRDGLPENYTNGHRFSIQNFMPISSKLRLSKSINKPLVLEILVYDRDGTVILKKVAAP